MDELKLNEVIMSKKKNMGSAFQNVLAKLL